VSERWRMTAKVAVVALALANLFFQWRYGHILTFDRPTEPVGKYVIPFQTHGTVEFISILDSWIYWSGFLFHIVFMVLMFILTRNPRRRAVAA
jgi:hypothetical protein